MSVIKKMLKQKAVYWAPGAADRFGRITTWADPVELRVRWEAVAAQYTDAQGDTQQSDGTVYVNVDVVVKGMLAEMELVSGINPDPRANGAQEIRHFEKLPNFKAKEFLRTCYLKRS